MTPPWAEVCALGGLQLQLQAALSDKNLAQVDYLAERLQAAAQAVCAYRDFLAARADSVAAAPGS